jgi:hypothetical protein
VVELFDDGELAPEAALARADCLVEKLDRQLPAREGPMEILGREDQTEAALADLTLQLEAATDDPAGAVVLRGVGDQIAAPRSCLSIIQCTDGEARCTLSGMRLGLMLAIVPVLFGTGVLLAKLTAGEARSPSRSAEATASAARPLALTRVEVTVPVAAGKVASFPARKPKPRSESPSPVVTTQTGTGPAPPSSTSTASTPPRAPTATSDPSPQPSGGGGGG